MTRWTILMLAVGLALNLTMPASAQGKGKQLTAEKTWKGSVADENLLKEKPASIHNTIELQKLFKAWKLPEQPPEIDFDKKLVVVFTTRGSLLQPIITLDDQRNLTMGGLASRDFGQGFRYVLAQIPRDGIKSIHGKPLPK